MACQADVRRREANAHVDHLAELLRDLSRCLQVLSDNRNGLHDRAEKIERGDGVIEAGHACQGRLKSKIVF
jgi:hypothetical protein